MRLVRFLALALALALVAACPRSSERERNVVDHPPAAPIMTNIDPDDPRSWHEAHAIAVAQNVGPVTRRSAALPFVFQATRGARCVLIHRGKLVVERGPAIAGAYLRDLGIAASKGPTLDDVLWVLWALEALPTVAPLAPEAYVHAPGNERLADLMPYIDYDGESARVVLHYLKPDASTPPGAPGRGAPGPITAGTAIGAPPLLPIRPMIRMTLTIPATGDASWQREELNWAAPG